LGYRHSEVGSDPKNGLVPPVAGEASVGRLISSIYDECKVKEGDTMLDKISSGKPPFITIECNLIDLPAALVEKITLHLMKGEEINLCVATRTWQQLVVYMATHNHVVEAIAYFDKLENIKVNDNYEKNESTSFLLSEIVGISHTERHNGSDIKDYNLEIFFRSGKLSLEFHNNKDVFLKFCNAIVSSSSKGKGLSLS